MGCFDVSCGISSISIKSGDKAALLLLVPQYSYPESTDLLPSEVTLKPGQMQVFNEGPLGMYMPFCLPIIGKYNDYGSLEDVVEDETTKALFEYFGATVEQIITIIHNGEYGTLYDPEILELYGDGLKIDKYSDKKVTEKWLLEAGFTEKDGKFFHPDVTNIIKWNETDNKIIKTEDQKAYVVFKEIKQKGREKDGKVSHIVYWKDEKWNETWPSHVKDFCESFMENTKPMGWFTGDDGVVLGIKKECLKKAKLLRKLSGMFIDGKIYDAMTDEVKTNTYYTQNASSILDCYMNKFIMDKIGFKFDSIRNEETEEIIQDKGESLTYAHNKYEILYTHDKAPGFKFGVRMVSPMATDMYKMKGDKLIEVKTYDGKRNYSPFSASGLAEMFKGETGNDLDLSGLDGVTTFDITLLKIQDLISRKNKSKEIIDDLRLQFDKFDKDNKSKEKDELLTKIWRFEDRSERREGDKDVLGNFNFPLVYDFYEKHFIKPSVKFKKSCRSFKNLMSSLWGLNRPLMPSAHFGQHGDYINQLEFANIVKNVLKDKMLAGYGIEFDDKKEMLNTLELLHGNNWTEEIQTTKDKKKEVNETVYIKNGQNIAVWNEEETYGYLITEQGR